jgi:hypothetical protein
VFVRGHHIDRQLRPEPADVINGTDAVPRPHPREIQIAEDKIELTSPVIIPAKCNGGGCLFSFPNWGQRKSGLCEHHFEKTSKVRVVVNYQHVLAGRSAVCVAR